MIYKYEMACKEAGLSDEATAEIRRFFDAEKKKLKRDKAYREAKGIRFRTPSVRLKLVLFGGNRLL